MPNKTNNFVEAVQSNISNAPENQSYQNPVWIAFVYDHAMQIFSGLVFSSAITIMQGFDFPLWLALFGAFSFLTHWMLIATSTSIHNFRLWLIAKKVHDVEMWKQFNAWKVQHAIEQKTSAQVDKHSQLQSNLNRLANYEDDPEEEYEYPDDILEDIKPSFKDEARKIILDFTGDMYTSGLLNDAGYIDNQEVVVPWGKKGRQQFEPDLRKLVCSLANDLSKLFIYDDSKRQWRINVKEYTTIESAIEYIDTIPTRMVG